MKLKRHLTWFSHGAVLIALLIYPSTGIALEGYSDAASDSPSVGSGFAREIQEGFDYTLRVIGAGNLLNPNNTFFEGRRYSTYGEFRPDVSLEYRGLRLSLKPRVAITSYQWEENSRLEGDWDSEDDWFINEALANLGLTSNLYASFGREVVMWGPSNLFSPSNPFYKANFKTNPLSEAPGMEFGRLLWIIDPTWTISCIANVNEGRVEFPFGFEPTYALKLDFTGDRKYFSLISSKRESDRVQGGAFGGWNVSDALTMYGEMSVFHGINPIYRLFQLERLRSINRSDLPIISGIDKYTNTGIETLLLVGASYTLEAGPTLTLEYVYNSEGLNDSQSDRLRSVLKKIEPAFDSFSVHLSPDVLNGIINPEMVLLQEHYLMFQYQQLQILNRINVLLRYLYSIDDHSSRLTPVISVDLDKHTRLYFVGRINFGSEYTESGFLYDSSYTVGFEYTF